jgi:DNA-binding response OmpR family regulator
MGGDDDDRPPPTVSATAPRDDDERLARVLLVEDEPLLVRTCGRILDQNFDVTVATSCEQALELIVSGGEPFDAIVCDLMMPGMTGIDLHATLLERHPEVVERIIFITGGPSAEGDAFLARITNPRLLKPFDVGELRAVVGAVAGEAHRARKLTAASRVRFASPLALAVRSKK